MDRRSRLDILNSKPTIRVACPYRIEGDLKFVINRFLEMISAGEDALCSGLAVFNGDLAGVIAKGNRKLYNGG